MTFKEVILIIVIFLISIGGSYYIGTLNSKYERIFIDKNHNDTVTTIKNDTIKIVTKGKIIYDTTEQEIIIKDTVKINVLPFISSIDSIVNQDTCKIIYYYPQNRFEVGINRQQASIITITKYVEVEKKIEWYESKPFNIGLGVLAGFGLGGLFK